MSTQNQAREPAVIDDPLLFLCVEEAGPTEFAGEIAKAEGYDFFTEDLLRLSYRDILRIDNLWCFTAVTKLQLDNNLLEKIEGLENFPNLVWLDLSFNKISVIEGLDLMPKIECLTLYSNRISLIKNLDKLKNLNVFSIGNNRISDLPPSIVYLRKFKKLQSLTLAGNEVCREERYLYFVLAHLPKLVHLDNTATNPEQVADAEELYEYFINDIRAAEEKVAAEEAKEEARIKLYNIHKEAFIENVYGTTMFDLLYEKDVDGKKFLASSDVADQVEIFRGRLTDVCKDLFDFGVEKHAERMKETDLFFECLREGLAANKLYSTTMIDDFLAYKEALWIDIMTYSHDMLVVNEQLQIYHSRLSDLYKTLLHNAMKWVDQVEEIVFEFQRVMNEMVYTSTEYVNNQMQLCRELETWNHEKFLEIAMQLMERAVKVDAELQFGKELAAVLVDKETTLGAVAQSHDVHLASIDTCANRWVRGLKRWMSTMFDDLHDRIEVGANRERILELEHFCTYHHDDAIDLAEEMDQVLPGVLNPKFVRHVYLRAFVNIEPEEERGPETKENEEEEEEETDSDDY